MKVQPGNGKNGKKDISLALLHGEAASSSVESAGCAYQSPSVIAAGADAGGVQLLSTLTNLVLAVMLIKVPSLVEGKQTALKRMTIKVALFSAFTWLPIVFVMSFLKVVDPLLLTALWILGLVPTVLLYPLRDNWLASLVPGDKMGRYLSWRSAIAGAFYLGTYYGMAWIIDRSSGGNAFRGYGFILAVAFLASTVSIVLYFGVRPPPVQDTTGNSAELGFISFLRGARKSHLGTFIFFVSLYTLAVNLAGPLFASYMLNDLKFNMMTFTAIVSCEYVARIISLTFWGRQVDKSGSLRILSIVSYLIPSVPILWVFSANFYYLCAIQMASGVVWAAFDLSVQTFIYKASAPAQRLRYIVYHRSLTSFAASMGTLLGMLLLGNIFAINGSSILTMFLLSGLLRLVIARVMLPKLTPEGIPDAVVHPELAGELANPAFTPGIAYYTPAIREFSRRAASLSSDILGKVSRVAVTRNGLFYKPWKWGEFLADSGVQPVMAKANGGDLKKGLYNKPEEWAEIQRSLSLAEKHEEPVAVRREGLYHNPQQWAELQKELAANAKPGQSAARKQGLFHNPQLWADLQKQLGIAAKAENPAVKRDGLFHTPELWTDYLQQSLVLNAVTTRGGGEGMTLRQGIYGHPELWDKYQEDTARTAAAKPLAPITRNGLLYKKDEWQKYKEKTAVRKPAARTPVPVAATISMSKTQPPVRRNLAPRPVVTRPVAANAAVTHRATTHSSTAHRTATRQPAPPTVRRLHPTASPA